MKKLFLIPLMLFAFTGCSLHTVVPSFWDDNQSVKIIDARYRIATFDCAKPHLAQITPIKNDVDWFLLYSESKGMLQNDVIALVTPLKQTVDAFYNRSLTQQGSAVYCKIKKQALTRQVDSAATAILGRW